MGMWRNWQTHRFQNPAILIMRVRFSPFPPIIKDIGGLCNDKVTKNLNALCTGKRSTAFSEYNKRNLSVIAKS